MSTVSEKPASALRLWYIASGLAGFHMKSRLSPVAAGLLCAFARGASAQTATIDWSRQLHTTAEDRALDVARDTSGNVIVGGYSNGTLFPPPSGPAAHGFVAKYDASGGLLWADQLAPGNVTNVAADAAANVYTLGDNNVGDGLLRKFDPSGGLLWTQQFGTTDDDYPGGMSLDAAGNVLVSGRIDNSFGSQDAFVARYTATGSQLWLRRFGTTSNDYARAVAADGSGGAIVVGSTGGLLGSAAGGSYDAFARKYDAAGNVVWTRQWGTTQGDHANAVAVDPTGNILIAGTTTASIDGTTSNPFGDEHSFVSKLASDGTIIWTHQFNFGSEDFTYDLGLDAVGNIYLEGAAYHWLTNDDFLIASLDDNGTLRWSQQFAGANQTDEWLFGMVVNPSGDKLWTSGYTTGSFNGGPNGNGVDDGLLVALNVVPEPSAALALGAGALLLRRGRRS